MTNNTPDEVFSVNESLLPKVGHGQSEVGAPQGLNAATHYLDSLPVPERLVALRMLCTHVVSDIRSRGNESELGMLWDVIEEISEESTKRYAG